jgi:microsomal epoxide hydrolase
MRKFEIAIPEGTLSDLRDRLARTRFPDQLRDARWDYGTELEYLKQLCAYWRDKFDWRAQERMLNGFDQFTTTIDGRRLHFVHVRSRHEHALPLVITHGWPGSFFEFYKVIGPLTDPEAHGGDRRDAFHVVCPSMPGYGFSEPPHERGFDVRKVAETVKALMAELGHRRYGAQGGDWGSAVTTLLGLLDAERVAGIHLNMVIARPPEGEDPAAGLTEAERAALAEARRWGEQETGYQRIQGTKPQTLGYGLNDSPAGLAAWIVEKFRTWSDCGGDVESRFSKDELLTNVTIYWVTQSITSSTRLYYESMRGASFFQGMGRVEVPTACAIFPKELARPPRRWAERVYNVQRWTEFPRGGHFAALEEPEALVEDLRASTATCAESRPCKGVPCWRVWASARV